MNSPMTLFTAALVVSAPAAAASPEEDSLQHDLECLIVTGSLIEAEETRAIGMLASTFFMGKIFGADPDIDIDSALERVAREFEQTTAQSLLQECGSEMELRGAQLKAAGKRLSDLGL